MLSLSGIDHIKAYDILPDRVPMMAAKQKGRRT
jgi:hypothetical protein